MTITIFRAGIGIVIVTAAAIWPFVAVWLSAHQIIRVVTEIQSCRICFLVALVAVVYQFTLRSAGHKQMLLMRVSAIVMLTIFMLAWGWSNKMFLFWKMKLIPTDTWQQMALDIDSLARQTLTRDHNHIRIKNLPGSFAQLGRTDECFGGDADFEWPSNNYEGVTVIYGNQIRRWYLVVGSEGFLERRAASKHRRIPVATNAFFFIGHDY